MSTTNTTPAGGPTALVDHRQDHRSAPGREPGFRSTKATGRGPGRRRGITQAQSRGSDLDARVEETRTLLEEALRFYHASGHARTGPITAIELARNVRGWTHTTRLRDFVRTTLTAKGERP